MAATQWAQEADDEGPAATYQLTRHGFVHCCTREQIVEVASWWLAAEAPLVALEIDADEAGDLRFEEADLGRRYPHVYNAIPRPAVVGVHELVHVEGGVELPLSLASPPPRFEVTGVLDGRDVCVGWSAGALDGDPAAVAIATENVDSGAQVPQFPGVTRPAALTTAYDAFCVLVAVLDEITDYRGDGFTTSS